MPGARQVLIVAAVTIAAAPAVLAGAQAGRAAAGPTRRTTTITGACHVSALLPPPARPGPGDWPREQDGLLSLEDGNTRVWLLAAPGGQAARLEDHGDVAGSFLDVGRLEPGRPAATGETRHAQSNVLNVGSRRTASCS